MSEAHGAATVYVTRALPEAAMTRLEEADDVRLVVNPHDRPVTREELLAGAGECAALICQLVDGIDEELLAAAPGLKVVANYAVGYDNVDVAAATARRIPVTNTPGVLTDATADHTWALLLAAARRVVEGDRLVRDGRWRGWAPQLLLGRGVAGKTLGIVGLGRIGLAVARRAQGFGMRILYASRRVRPLPPEVTAERVPLERLLAEADFVSVHVPLGEQTRHLIGAAALEAMKPSAYLINTARGPVVDEAALVAALEAGSLAGAALDVFEEEPAVHPGLLGRDDVVLAPHTASATLEARTAMGRIAVDNALAVLRGQRPASCVNPEVFD